MALGIFIALEPASREMETLTAAADLCHSPDWDRDYPRPQTPTFWRHGYS